MILRAKHRLLEGWCLAWDSLVTFATFINIAVEETQESKVPGFFPSKKTGHNLYILKVRNIILIKHT